MRCLAIALATLLGTFEAVLAETNSEDVTTGEIGISSVALDHATSSCSRGEGCLEGSFVRYQIYNKTFNMVQVTVQCSLIGAGGKVLRDGSQTNVVKVSETLHVLMYLPESDSKIENLACKIVNVEGGAD